ncbi:hypothetical protein [Corynebacterium pilosum]|uniref:Hypothetical membrane protein n=1 Tax=Corynebacterium pilosum TaxID=35756 RepID=A0A376CI81_9CORY|nr:hypothetical protein [Corynebacterium pilosum]STC67952.1 hypothetical membrane protein [Corynebacterium pilosum]
MTTPPEGQHNRSTAEALAKQERKVAGVMEMGNLRWVLAGCILVFVIALLLPFTGGHSGLEVLAYTEASRADVKITENLFVWVGTLGVVVFGLITVITRKSTPFLLTWALTTIALIEALLAIWLRQTSEGYTTAFGLYLAIAVVVVAEVVCVMLATRRSPEQQEIARQRRSVDDTDEVGRAQLSASSRAAEETGEVPAALVDDRRAKAAERHRRQGL